MNENDAKVRRQWLIMLILSISNSLASSFLEYQFNPLYVQMSTFPLFRYAFLFTSLLAFLVFGYITYRCAYKKQGTKLLTFFLITMAVCLVVTPALYFSDKLSFPNYIPYYGSYFALTQIFAIWWFIICWKMRKINKRLKGIAASGI